MKALRTALILLMVYGLSTTQVLAANGDPPVTSPDKHELGVLRAMSENSTEGHPDLHGQFQGMIRYEKGDYAGAMQYFLLGARYADKVSQLCIGLLYLNGQGVSKDPVKAYAWVALASERNYQPFVATRDEIGRQLNAQQMMQAHELVRTLTAEYGDAVAKPRLSAELMQGSMHMTGSMLGFSPYTETGTAEQYLAGTNYRRLAEGEAPPNCASGSVEGAGMIGCGDFWSREYWKPSLYFKAADSFWQSKVTVGALQNANAAQNPAALSGSEPSGYSNP